MGTRRLPEKPKLNIDLENATEAVMGANNEAEVYPEPPEHSPYFARRPVQQAYGHIHGQAEACVPRKSDLDKLEPSNEPSK